VIDERNGPMSEPDPLAPLRDPGLDRLWSSVRKRLENNGLRITSVPLKLGGLHATEIEALCALLGRRRPSDDAINVDLRRLDRLLASSAVELGLIDTLEALDGPLRDRQGERLARNMARLEVQMSTDGHPMADDPDVRRWIEHVRQRGLLTRIETNGANAKEAMIATLDGVRWLLASEDALRTSPIPLSTLAAMQSGDAHALDPDTAVGGLLADALGSLSGADDARSAWQAFGVQLDQVSSSALALSLPGSVGSICGAATADGQALRITWRMFEHGFGLDPTRLRGARVRICENPAVVSMAADQLGGDCAPLVCTEGMPSGVTAALIGALADAGADLRVHADFDLGGVAIVHHIIGRFDAVPWRMSAANYLGALDGPTTALDRRIGTIEWDPELADAMNAHRRSIHEEALVADLLGDLADLI